MGVGDTGLVEGVREAGLAEARLTADGGQADVGDQADLGREQGGDEGVDVAALVGRPVLNGQETPELVAFHESQAMGNDLTKIEDIVSVVTLLAVDGRWVTCQTISANGGYTTR
ncbi:hypothetical protein [Streptomyces scopuliridis]|uniref:hypothetical protein n=1 Tax=Streptomyces scopuliridis TaxID=452529 RepID=UPI0036CD2D40